MMKSGQRKLACRSLLALLPVGLLFAPGFSQQATGAQHLTVAQPGGMPGAPLITGITQASNRVTVTWDGPSGYYQLYQKPSVSAPAWQKVGGLSLSRVASVTPSSSNAVFRVSGPAANYAGSHVCLECHTTIYNNVARTPHTAAFSDSNFARSGGQTSGTCLRCHTVGYGLATGYNLQTRPQHLRGVQCENCHGPAGNHALNESNPLFKPRVELAGQVCGGCHQSPNAPPTFNEWASSGHAQVVENMNPSSRISACGRCHSGSARLALLKGKNPSITVSNDANVAIVCATCHTAHSQKVWTNVISHVVYTNQLRNPVSSLKDYYLSTSDAFATKYNANINVCAQCHNHRGASWQTTDRAPHGSPQYNMLIGTVGELADGSRPNRPASHALLIDKQCVGCHMQTAQGEDAQLADTGHKFTVTRFDLCIECHPAPELLLDFTTNGISSQIQDLKAALDLWATTEAPEALRNKYGERAWEYTSPGELSNPGGVGGPGPSAAEQALIPVNIRKARFNVYLVFRDRSFGVHNPRFSTTLLETAENWIAEELNP